MGIIGEIVSDRSDPLAPSAAMSGNLKDGHMHLAWPRDATECRRWTRWHGTPNLGAGPAAFLLNGDERLPHRWNIHGRTRPFPRVPRTLWIRAQRRSGEALRRCQCSTSTSTVLYCGRKHVLRAHVCCYREERMTNWEEGAVAQARLQYMKFRNGKSSSTGAIQYSSSSTAVWHGHITCMALPRIATSDSVTG